MLGGNDSISSSRASIELRGFDGDDSITANGANQTVVGGDGADFIRARDNGQTVDGGIGGDTIQVEDNNITVDAGGDDDTVRVIANYGGLDLNGGAGTDLIDFDSHIRQQHDFAGRPDESSKPFANGSTFVGFERIDNRYMGPAMTRSRAVRLMM